MSVPLNDSRDCAPPESEGCGTGLGSAESTAGMGEREVFFVADDFGWSAEANRAIVRAHTEGMLTGASLMMGQPGTAQAVELARSNPTLRIGWHLHLCHSRPFTTEVWPWGDSPERAALAMGRSAAARALVRREIAAQWESFRETSLACAFVNSHHHLHAHPAVYGVLLKTLPPQFSGWLRLGRPRFFSRGITPCLVSTLDSIWGRRLRRRCPHRVCDTVWGSDRTFRMQSGEVTNVLSQLGDGLHEFLFHPRGGDSDMDLKCLIELKRDGC
jgi:hypothetical protein